VIGYQCFRGPYPEDGGSVDLWNTGTLPQHYNGITTQKTLIY